MEFSYDESNSGSVRGIVVVVLCTCSSSCSEV